MMNCFNLLILLLIFSISQVHAGAVEKCVDETGKVTYTDKGCKGKETSQEAYLLGASLNSGDIEVIGDEKILRQVMFNLLSNAMKFTPSDGFISVEAIKAHDSVNVSVSDTGIGIRPSDLETIFGAFQQVDSSFSRETEGTGLGLALTRRLVRLHGGRISAESDGLGKGSRFTFTIPVSNQKGMQS